jgi:uncharacterized membrane protein YdjX (TVP38/TMEM64 family)
MLIEEVKKYITEMPEMAALLLVIAKIIGAIILFPGTPLTLLAGATLGTFWGSIVSVIGNTLGATAAFIIARFFLRDWVQDKFLSKYKNIEKYESRFLKKGLFTVILLRLIPLFPFNVLNYLLGVTKVSTKDYVIGTFIGIIPGTIAFVYFGEALKMLSFFHITSAILGIVALTFIGKYYDRKFNK